MKAMKITNWKILASGSALALLLFLVGAWAQSAHTEKSYPQHGKVIAARLGITDTAGNGFGVASFKKWIYRVNCGDLYYDLEGNKKPRLPSARTLIFGWKKKRLISKAKRKKQNIGLWEWASPITNKTHIRTLSDIYPSQSDWISFFLSFKLRDVVPT